MLSRMKNYKTRSNTVLAGTEMKKYSYFMVHLAAKRWHWHVINDIVNTLRRCVMCVCNVMLL